MDEMLKLAIVSGEIAILVRGFYIGARMDSTYSANVLGSVRPVDISEGTAVAVRKLLRR